jgi:hypothetical protein
LSVHDAGKAWRPIPRYQNENSTTRPPRERAAMLSPQRNQSFTSNKLTWMSCVMSTTTLTPFEKCVAYVIENAINEHTRDWKLSDETIAALAGRPGAIRAVQRARRRLRDAGWIGWKRTRDANVYFLCHENVPAAMDEITKGRLARKERRNKSRYDTSVVSRYDTSVEQIYSEDIHDSQKKKSLPQRKESNAAELRLMRVVGGGQ